MIRVIAEVFHPETGDEIERLDVFVIAPTMPGIVKDFLDKYDIVLDGTNHSYQHERRKDLAYRVWFRNDQPKVVLFQY
jgi:hypothetical protein